MAPYQQRVLDEKQELDLKIAKLSSFMTDAIFVGLSSDEQDRLIRQHDVMTEYSRILGERISAFIR